MWTDLVTPILGGTAGMLVVAGYLGKLFLESRLSTISETRLFRGQEVITKQRDIVSKIYSLLRQWSLGASMARFHSVGLPEDMKNKQVKRLEEIRDEMITYFADNELWLSKVLAEDVRAAMSLMNRAVDRYYGSGHLDRITTNIDGKETSDDELDDQIKTTMESLKSTFRSLFAVDITSGKYDLKGLRFLD